MDLNSLDKYRTGKNALAKLLEAKLTGKRIPVRVFLQMTKFCNMRCKHCWVYQADYQEEILKTKEPTTREMKKLIDLLYDRGTRWINFLGGEPLIRDDLGELLDYSRKKGIYCEMSTNGLLADKKINVLKKVHNLCISIDGDKTSNDAIRGKDTYEKIIKAIETVVKNGLKLRIHAVLSGYTKNSLNHMVALSKKYGLVFNFAECSLPDIDNRDDKLLLSDKEILSFYKKYREYKMKTPYVANSLTAIDAVIHWPLPGKRTIYQKDLPKIKKGTFVKCQLGERSCMVDVDGKVYTCPERWKDGLSLYDVGFDKAWEYLANRDCVACRILGSTEQSLTLDLSPKPLLNAITRFA